MPLACAALVISVFQKRICNILALLPPLMWFVWEPGSMEMNALPHVSPLSRGFTVPLKASFPTVSLLVKLAACHTI